MSKGAREGAPAEQARRQLPLRYTNSHSDPSPNHNPNTHLKPTPNPSPTIPYTMLERRPTAMNSGCYMP